MSIKKILSVTLALAMLAACSGGGNTSSQTPDQSQGGEAPPSQTSSQPAGEGTSSQATDQPEEGDNTMNELTNPQLASAGRPTAVIKTTLGDITVQLYPQEAPKAVENFLTHAKNGYYDGIIFHRVIQDFMIQGGDPTGTGRGGESIWGESFEDEFSHKLHNFRGALSMANSGINTNGSKFFIVQCADPLTDATAQSAMLQWTVNRFQRELDLAPQAEAEALMKELNTKLAAYQGEGFPQEMLDEYQPAVEQYKKVGGTPHLDYKHTVFGQVISGMEVVDAIAGVKTGSGDKPSEDVKILGIQVNE